MAVIKALRVAWKHRELALLALLLLALLALRDRQSRVRELSAALASKPKIEERVSIKHVAGPVRIVEKIVEGPGKDRVIDRVIYRDSVQTTETVDRRSEPQGFPEPKDRRWIAGASVSPLDWRRAPLVRAGYSFGGRFDLTYGYVLDGPGDARHRAEFAVRF